jgi:hypothetical protein
MRLVVAAISALMFTSTVHAQKQFFSGNDMLEPCGFAEAMTSGQIAKSKANEPSSGDALMQGMCWGMIGGIRFFAASSTYRTKSSVCIPEEATLGQMLSVIVRYMRNNPQNLHENFMYLAMAAVQGAWPCK